MVEQMEVRSTDNNFDTQSIPVFSYKNDEVGTASNDFIVYSASSKKGHEEETPLGRGMGGGYSIVQSYFQDSASEKQSSAPPSFLKAQSQ
mmetsp:Transcript_15225/g.14801  ORF Transcript_15225/g.14801 Transcript_15225/m.14801 type:complete len:90 (-) Transcript_15225:517-786(-)